MKIITKDEVIKELGVVPGELDYDFYIRKVTEKGTALYSDKGSRTSEVFT